MMEYLLVFELFTWIKVLGGNLLFPLRYEGIFLVLWTSPLNKSFKRKFTFSLTQEWMFLILWIFSLNWSHRRRYSFPLIEGKYFLLFKLFYIMKFHGKWEFSLSNLVNCKMNFEIFRSIYGIVWDDHERSWDNDEYKIL